jgi:hypothetical protein
MRRSFTCLALVLSSLACRGAVIDRIAVTVGRQVITESDVIREIRIAAFLDQKPVEMSGEQKRKAADRLVDQTLILTEAASSRAALPGPAYAAGLLEQVKSQYPSASEYDAALKRYQITEVDLSAHLLAGLEAMSFTDLRFRPEVQVSADEVREFYDQMAATNPSRMPDFETSRQQMESLLTDQRVAQALDRWLGTQRNQTEILYREAAFQ